ncbi:riboflavin synthase [Staphylococcus condimenti]|uniref:Riboflavin synthase n=1 Tax=Staphylococcus condimenti TaxID=70255 RepID=A0A143P7L8_9STAP|nr:MULTISPECIES: riboflavin synthase [Staphylococcus]AMY04505.1 riboflavin synthase subunit alpha [Staphylococcus condimenti]APR60742.1 riboflavin synthase subunit alpha [Staphylococcus condimenti]MDK8644815.1 riboflavin synthase [Staphylococcus condimenti]OFO98885.1 riboflavin synthase subunit alpha [Staphylococcus sp. HMSC065E08]PNZ57251.1 riboflavin synthase [Staphylococcus condimenti]
MFTGIVEEVGTVVQTSSKQNVMSLTIECDDILEDIHIGDSISVNGACLTVISFTEKTFDVQVIKGTENKTYLSELRKGSEVNLERAMPSQGRFGGHFVLGHVDEVGTIKRIQPSANSNIVTIQCTPDLTNQMVQQGSITVDGVSLTIFRLGEGQFDIHLIPETKRSTILSTKKIGDKVHLEADMLFKYVQKAISKNESGLTREKLSQFGF